MSLIPITGKEFYELLESELENEIKDYEVVASTHLVIHIMKITTRNVISNCKFIGDVQFFDPLFAPNKDYIHTLVFKDCSFEKLIINNCYFEELSFTNVEAVSNIMSITECNFNYFKVETTHELNCIFNFSNNTVNFEFHLTGINIGKGNFYLRKNIFPLSENNFSRTCFINGNQLHNCDIYENDFGVDMSFTNNNTGFETEYSQNFFKNCIFNNASFYKTDFGNSTEFKKCIFNGVTKFDNIKNDLKTNLSFNDCSFKSSTSFRKARIQDLSFNHSTFESSTFFQNTYFNRIKLDNSIFEKSAFFDDVQIKDIDNCDRRTIRNIKLHLQKTENRIDYNRFRVFEFEAYKNDIRKQIKEYREDKKLFYHRKRQIKHFKRDLFILNITGFVSDYGTDWKRALKFTLLLGFLLYIPFFIFENWSYTWDWNNWQIFPIGFLRFFILTDFYSPLKDGRTYIDMDGWNHLFSWIIFILGKIVIAFGIYEMIQAFRKFKA